MKFSKIIISTACAFAMMSCNESFLENVPQGTLNDGVMNSPESVDLLVNSAYASLYGFLEGYHPNTLPTNNWSYGEVRSDNAYKGGGGTGDVYDIHLMETFDNTSETGNLDQKWFLLYCSVSRCNSALRVLNNVTEEEVPAKKARIAEMKVLRSHFYFELVRFFNKIPYQDENLPTTEYINVRNDEFTRDQHLSRIAAEMIEASADLPTRQDEKGRINKNIALAYAAKVKLYQAYEQDPATNKVININKSLLNEVISLIDQVQGYGLLPDFQDLDLVESDNGIESVFDIQYSTNDGTADAGRVNWSMQLCQPTGPVYGGDCFFLPSQDLINAYQTDENGLPVFDYQSRPDYASISEDATTHQLVVSNTTPNVDPRLDFVVGRPGITWKNQKDTPYGFDWARDPGAYGYNGVKRFILDRNDPNISFVGCHGLSGLNWHYIRYADLLLWKAEALIELGRQDEALPLINRIRQRAMDSKYVKDFNDPSKDAANYKIGLYTNQGWTQEYARQALRTETRLEKAMEGERYFDLVRWGITEEVMTKYLQAEKDNRPYYQNTTFKPGREYFAIPVAQYNFSYGRYTQNPGYPSF
ncbi:MAG: RagB/SusD family nutrient uptake outer membrane protein [Muribaculaceae bacterium]|nr:RagB/SusD family nutrient uptake outer membrane protein [Muribaculaceae bacterium]